MSDIVKISSKQGYKESIASIKLFYESLVNIKNNIESKLNSLSLSTDIAFASSKSYILNNLSSVLESINNGITNIEKYIQVIEEFDKDEIDGKITVEEKKETINVTVETTSALVPTPNSIPTSKKSNEEIAYEVIDGKWGNGEERKRRLASAGYDYTAIQAIVNSKLHGNNDPCPTPKPNPKPYANDGTVVGDTSHLDGDLEKKLDSVSGTMIDPPSGLGDTHTYMGWQMITCSTSDQYILRETASKNGDKIFNKDGYGMINGRYVVATTSTYGNVGDYIDVYQEDGTVIKCIIGDIKDQNDAGCTKWGHNNGDCIIEFVVDKDTWYNCGHSNPGTNNCWPEIDKDISYVLNKGSYYDYL